MKFRELINYLDEQFPRYLSMPGDNDGVDVCVDYNLEIGRILVVLDITFESIDYAITNGYNCILSHHTVVHEPIKKLDLNNSMTKKAIMLARHDICAASYHTRLDSADGGVNDCLLKASNIADNNIEILFYPDGNVPIGRIVTLDKEMDLHDFAGSIKKSLEEFYIKEFSRDVKIDVKVMSSNGKSKKIGVVCGSGMSFVDIAAKMEIDTFFTGESKYYSMLGAYENYNINIITAGHVETETVVLPFMKQTIIEKFPEAKVDCFIGTNINL